MHEQINNIKKKPRTIKIGKSTPYSKPYASIKNLEIWFEWGFFGPSSINGYVVQISYQKKPKNIYVIYLQMWKCKIKQTYLMNISLWKNAFYYISTGSKRTSIKQSQKTGTLCVCGTCGNIRTPNFGIAISLVLNVCVL